MPLSQCTYSLNTALPRSKSVRPLQSGESYSLIVCNELPSTLYYKLTKHFHLTQYSPDLDMDSFDAGLIDCRGTVIDCPEETVNHRPAIIFALIDEHSYLPVSPQDTTSRMELLSESDLDSSTLPLRIAACKRFNALASIKPVPLMPSDDIVKGNAYEILTSFVRNSTDWMVFKDLEHRFLMVSDRFLKSHKKTAKEIIGKNDLEIGTPEELVLGNEDKNWKGYWKLDDEVIASGEPSHTEHLVIHENALEQVREHVAKIPIKNHQGNVIGLLVCITQVHESKILGGTKSELASRRNIEVSPIIKGLDDERNKAVALKSQVQSAFKRKNNFIATASHDLRQPLHAIGLFIESLQQQIVNPEQLSTLAKMKQSSADLNELLNSILDISKLDADAVQASKTHFSIAHILQSIEDEFGTVAKDKSLTLHVANTNAVVHTDSLLLTRVLKNLVSNAVKYTNYGSVNLITEVESDSLLIHVKDSGPGIPEEQYMAIFDEYHQLDNQDSQPNFGMGLGLSIVKRLTDLLDLDITLDSKLDGGTRFTLSVPLGEATDSKSEKAKNAKPETLEALRIMIVEDNPLVLEAMQQMLSGMNCDAYPASNIPEALEIIEELDELPELLVVDYQLADGVTGDVAIAKICEAAGEDLPSIIVTGNTNNALIRKASQSTYRVLNKPVNANVLLSSINSAIKECSLSESNFG